ncbi:hypothetical protein RHMOL_Rhmol11G0260300 [Rhododendron molle]|uniref:Uncharacterized protein n=1 Tax=Rhododendron molle TaxID=49168 RepID=A0ACC0LXD8_RHOML|nr:hypothetical protein RHMOL_Rhmol11G0260300 [Rhododendron molle]
MLAENPAFFYAFQGDNINIFWADETSRMNYNYFGDTVKLDMFYMNNYKVPFAAFTGLNHHRQQVLFGCALLLNESDSTFVRLIQTWLHVMSGRFPISITDEHRIDSANLVFDGYVNATTTLQFLIKQYGKAVAGWHEKELKADYDTTSRYACFEDTITHGKQAADIYTKFQEKLVQTLANPATKIEESGTITSY